MTNPDAPLGRRRWTLGWMMIGVAAVAIGLTILRPAYFLLDSMFHGPVTRSFDREHSRIAAAANLVGRTEAEAIKVMGEPTEVWEYGPMENRTTTLAYSPSFSGDYATFQVHCQGGVVQSIGTKGD